jgi:hypothetical protein
MEQDPSTSSALVRKVGNALGRSRFSRRGFFGRVAVVGAALSLDPVSFATKPASAYASVCGTNASCADGYSVFCCTINNGGNFCPEGSFLGGWWKADNSGFCCGGPRYYLDCNVSCGTPSSCGCETSSATCDNRLVACNQFRYGQCHLEIDCYGPVLCRLVTCTPPWVFDPSCTSSSASDNDTASHTAPCLPGSCPDPLTLHYYDLGGPGGPFGPEVVGVQSIPEGTWLQLANGALFDVWPWGFVSTFGALYAKYLQLGGPLAIGVPTQDDFLCSDRVGQYNVVERVEGSASNTTVMYWNPTVGAGSVTGPIFEHFFALGSENGPLGYPTSDQLHTQDGTSTYTTFSKVVNGVVSSKSAIYNRGGTPVAIIGDFFDEWSKHLRELGPLGYARSELSSGNNGSLDYRVQLFDKGAIYGSQLASPASLWGSLYAVYLASGGPTGSLGLPLTTQVVTNGVASAGFQGGTLRAP